MKINLSQRETERLKQMRAVFDCNYRATQLFSRYLNEEPDFVSADMISSIAGEVGVSEEYAFAMILSSLFGLESDVSKEDRTFERTMVIPAVRRLSVEKYKNDPYYKNIKIPEINIGNWRFTKETYPAYRGFVCDDQHVLEDMTEIPAIGFFDEDFSFPAVLENGNEWMTLTPVDVDTCQNEIDAAHGKVVTFGLGLGYYTYMVSQKENVSSVTVVEASEDVISIFKEYILPQFPNKDKVRIVHSDAFAYAEHVMPGEKFNYAFVDTWRDASDGYPMYMKMKKLESLSPNTVFSYWIEGFILSHMRSLVFENIYGENGRAIPIPNEITSVDQIRRLLSNDILAKLAKGERVFDL